MNISGEVFVHTSTNTTYLRVVVMHWYIHDGHYYVMHQNAK